MLPESIVFYDGRADNEPSTPYDRYSHIVELDDTTKTVGQKYFRKTQTLSRCVTMGMLHIESSRQIILAVSGKGNAAILKRLCDAEPGPALPASY